jgi:nitrate reductase beta subunit
MPDLDDMRIPVKYLANLLTGGKEAPIRSGLEAHDGHAPLYAQQDVRGEARCWSP